MTKQYTTGTLAIGTHPGSRRSPSASEARSGTRVGATLRSIMCVLIFLAFVVGTPRLHAQCDGRWITSLDQGVPGVSGTVLASTSWDPDGANGEGPELLIVGGAFQVVGATFASNIAAWDGRSWQALGAGFDGFVDALCVHDGELIAGGRFVRSGTTQVNYVAAWNGTEWRPLTTGTNGGVQALASYNGRLVAGGVFSSAGGRSALSIAQWDGSQWNSLGTGTDRFVNALAVHQGELIIGGSFLRAGTVQAAARIAAWNGTGWRSLGSGFRASSGSVATVYALASMGDSLVAAGTFDRSGETPISGIAIWNGATWQALQPWGGGIIRSVAAYQGSFFAGSVVASSPTSVGRWNGAAWVPVGAGLRSLSDSGAQTYTFTIFRGALVAGGQFSFAGSQYAGNLAAWNGEDWSGFEGGVATAPNVSPPEVRTLASFDGRVFAGGRFAAASTSPTTNIAYWSPSGWRSTGVGASGSVRASHVWNGDLYVGGTFGQVDGVNASRIARWNRQSWSDVGGGVTRNFSPIVTAMTTYASSLVVAGVFTQAGQLSASNIASWDGQLWSPFGSGIDGEVSAVLEWNGTLIAAGGFSNAGGTPVRNIAAWNGSSWASLGQGLPAAVTSLVEFRGELIAGGNFTGAGTPSHIARWDGVAWQPLDRGFDQAVIALAVLDDELYAGGYMTLAGTTPVSRIARWNGQTWGPLAQGLTPAIGSVDAPVRTIVVHSGELLVGGSFHRAGDLPAYSVARWNPAGSLPALTPSVPAVLCTGRSVALPVTIPRGYEPLSFRWEVEDAPGSQQWRALSDGAVVIQGQVVANATGTAGSTLLLTPSLVQPVVSVRCLVSHSCGIQIVNVRPFAFLYCCPADLDDGTGTGTPDGGVTIEDLLYYLDQYAQGTPRADLDDGSSTGTPDGGVTIDDLLYFLVRYDAGC